MPASLARLAMGPLLALVGAVGADPAVAQAETGRLACTLSSTTGELSLRVEDWGGLQSFALFRESEDLVPYGDVVLEERHRLPCQGQPTVTTTDRITIGQAPRLLPPIGNFDFHLESGPLAPGRTPEATGESEIEVAIALPGIVDVSIYGPDEPATYTATRSHKTLRLNLNGDDDFDFALAVTSTNLFGSAADDLMDATGRRKGIGRSEASLTLFGEGGSDRLITGGGRDGAVGGQGADFIDTRQRGSNISGGNGNDRIIAGPSYQLINAGAGNDRINARGGGRDEIDCGPGEDVARVDRKDTGDISGCERIRAN